MGVILQATCKFPNGHSVPAPVDGNRRIPWWWDHLAAQANAFRQAGFTAILLPPALKTSAGAFPGADGYGTFDDYDLGNKSEFFSTPTRFGNREQLQRCTAIMRANGLDVYLDIVLHQRDGGNKYVYKYSGANGDAGVDGSPRIHNASSQTSRVIRSQDRYQMISRSATNSRLLMPYRKTM